MPNANHPRKAPRWAVPLAVAVSTAVLAPAAGWEITRRAVDDGTERFDRHPEATVAAEAVALAEWYVWDHPAGRVLFPAVRVVAVRHDPGHCRGTYDKEQPELRDYRAEVRAYTYFAIPARTLHVTCGGWGI